VSDDLAPHGQPTETREGPWSGWKGWRGELYPFEHMVGPFYFRSSEAGLVRCAFRVEAKHLNGSGRVHGGCMATFADYAAYCIAWEELKRGASVTAALDCQYIGSAALGDLVEAGGEIIKAGRSLVFVRGLITCGASPLLAFSGLVRRLDG
jgi:uncharacterized protein (TIGR00369 family)